MKIAKFAVCLVVLVMLVGEVRVSMAVTCAATELASCYAAITSNQRPSELCCSKLREQRPCLCGYLRDPNLRQFVNTPNARRVASTCGVPFPNC